MQKITRERLADMLKGVKGATFASIVADTDARLKGGKSGPYAGTRKVSVVNVTLNAGYEKAVNRQLVREGETADFEAKDRQWGEHVESCPLIENKGKLYLQGICNAVYSVTFLHKGRVVAKEQLTEFLPTKSDASHQGTDKEIVVRSWGLDSIKEITLKGERYQVSE